MLSEIEEGRRRLKYRGQSYRDSVSHPQGLVSTPSISIKRMTGSLIVSIKKV